MIFQLDVKYNGKDKLIQDTLEYINSHKFVSDKAEMKILDLDPFFLNVIEQYNLGTKITYPRVHFMMPNASHEAGHNHQTATGVYYLQIPKNSGNLKFPYLHVEIEPHEELLVIVPAKEIHAISKNTSNEIRLALAFCIE